MAQTDEIQDLLDFWYSERISARWFASTPALDDEIRARFEGLWQRGRAGQLATWEASPEGALALAIVLDQLPLNMFRGQPGAFSTEQQAVTVTKAAIQNGFAALLPQERVAFLFMPLMHSENLADQDLSVECFRGAGLENNVRFAEHHRGIVRRFGRFPHRNALLGRVSTPEELAYLASPEAFKG